MRLIAARNLQALSLGFHIILVCFGVAFPVFVLTMEGLYLRRVPRVFTHGSFPTASPWPSGPGEAAAATAVPGVRWRWPGGGLRGCGASRRASPRVTG